MDKEKIVIIDDELELMDIVKSYLEIEGYEVFLFDNGETALGAYKTINPVFFIIDIMLPGINGIDICKELRKESTALILMLSAKSSDVDKIIALGFGADDYMTKPFSPRELVARVKAHLRRYTKLINLDIKNSIKSENNLKENEASNILKFNELRIDLDSHRVFVNDIETEPLAAKEFELLVYLAKNPNRVFKKEELYDKIWGFNDFGDINTVTVHIRKIREKIEKEPSNPRFIKTVWRVGYKFMGDDYEL